MSKIESILAGATLVTALSNCAGQRVDTERAKTAADIANVTTPPVAHKADTVRKCMIKVNQIGRLPDCIPSEQLGSNFRVDDEDGTVHISFSATCPNGRVAASDPNGTYGCLPLGSKTFGEFKTDCSKKVSDREGSGVPKVVLSSSRAGLYLDWQCRGIEPSIRFDAEDRQREIDLYFDKDVQAEMCEEQGNCSSSSTTTVLGTPTDLPRK